MALWPSTRTLRSGSRQTYWHPLYAFVRRQGYGTDESNATGQFERLKPFLTGEESRMPYQKVGEELGMTEGAVKTAVYRLRKSFGAMLRAEIAETVADPEEIDDEIRHLLAVVQPLR